MEIRAMGMSFSHKKGEFCRKAQYDEYVFCCFETPFVYLKNGKMEKGNAGDILINEPKQTVYHGPTPAMTKGFKNDWMHIKGEDFKNLLKKYPLPIGEAFSVGKPYFLREHMGKIFAEYQLCGEGSAELINCFITEMVINLYRETENQKSEATNAAIASIRREILRAPEKKWSLKNMASVSGYSVSRFCEIYSAMYKNAPMRDVLCERIRLAKRLLCSGQASVTQISEMCGFSSIGHFSKTFKKQTGKTPTEFRK